MNPTYSDGVQSDTRFCDLRCNLVGLELVKGRVTTNVFGVATNPHDVFPINVKDLEIYYKELYTVLVGFRGLKNEGRRNADIVLHFQEAGDPQVVLHPLPFIMPPPHHLPSLMRPPPHHLFQPT